MSQQAAVTLNSVVYNPSGANNGTLYWWDRSGGVANSFSPLTQVVTSNSGASKSMKFSWRLVVPVVAGSDSSCSCAGSLLRSSAGNIVVTIDPNSTAAERADLYARLVSLIASDPVKNAIQDLNPAYA